ncbi:hypothetical protein F4780DRAFT_739095 [Xylariomycetidae sp. FL0641]|nr:hypothetical protein F4780DRAFT_739095 [Xylariomycetidae sp. FL0641]
MSGDLPACLPAWLAWPTSQRVLGNSGPAWYFLGGLLGRACARLVSSGRPSKLASPCGTHKIRISSGGHGGQPGQTSPDDRRSLGARESRPRYNSTVSQYMAQVLFSAEDTGGRVGFANDGMACRRRWYSKQPGGGGGGGLDDNGALLAGPWGKG